MKFRRIISHALPVFLFAILAGGSSETDSTSDPVSFTQTNAGIYCKSVIQKMLRDPDSYKYEDAYVQSSKVAIIQFRSKNGFGGYVRGKAECTTYQKDGQNWFSAKMLD